MELMNNEDALYLKMDAELCICCPPSPPPHRSGLSAVVMACVTMTLITTLNTLI